jgi:hypothetical protein
MKLKLIGSAIVLALGLANVAYAKINTYYPPERMHCGLSDAGKLSCHDFNRQYLTEDTYTANLSDKEEAFYFYSAAAYYAPSREETSVFFTYHNAKGKMAKLKTIQTTIRPDLSSGKWRKVGGDIYVCDAGYMSCGITSLPEAG